MNQYLGDGVYLSHDGHQLWLAVNRHANNVVALEPEVFLELVKRGANTYCNVLGGVKFADALRKALEEGIGGEH